MSVAVMESGIYVSAKVFPSKICSRNDSIFFPFRSHFFISGSISLIQGTFAMISSISRDDLPRARRVAMIAPILVPESAIGRMSSSSSLRMTPICASPRAAHHPRAREKFIYFELKKFIDNNTIRLY